jgi:hypothetical protein
MITAISEQCADLRRLLPAAAAVLAEPDADGTASRGGVPGTRPPWNAAAASALLDAHEGVRRLEASMRRDVTGHTGPKRGGSDANTIAAIKAIEALAHAVGDDAAADAGRILERWSRRIRELPAVDESQPWRKMPGVQCPYCGFPMLWVQARAGRVACLRGGACLDGDGRHPIGRLDVSRLTGDPLIQWADGLVTP